MKRTSAIFALSMGILMVIVWIMYLATGQYDFTTEPIEAITLLAAEILTALSLIIAGTAVLAQRAWGIPVHLASMGMMLYTSIYSIGVFYEDEVVLAALFFVILTGFTIFIILQWALRPSLAANFSAGQPQRAR